ncbi:MAG: hypothetical protein J7647_07900 [Cyanobacteria bacterium SBLK]|nr:hypothetical protein [Cyanobacteria bacterium SBLK]
MPVLNLTTDQIIDLVKQLSPEEQQAVIEAIEEAKHRREVEVAIRLYGDIETYQYMEEQGKLFDSMLPELLEKYQGMYIYFENGKVLEADFDEEKLIDLAEQKYGYKPMFIEQVCIQDNSLLFARGNLMVKSV